VKLLGAAQSQLALPGTRRADDDQQWRRSTHSLPV
jgi:hypothetical protein